MKSPHLFASSVLLLLSSPSYALPLGHSFTTTSSLSLSDPSTHHSHKTWEAAGNITKHIGSHISQYISWPFTKLSSTVTHITVDTAWSYQTTHEGEEWAIVPLYPSGDKIPSVHHMMRHPMVETYGSEHSKELKREEEDYVLEDKMDGEHVLEARMERPEGGGVRPMTPTSAMSPETTTPAGIKGNDVLEPRMERPEGGGVRPVTLTSAKSPETTTPAGIKGDDVLERRLERPSGGGVRPMTPTSAMSPETTTPAGIKETFASESQAKDGEGNVKRQSITEIDNFYFNGTGNLRNDVFAWLWFKSLGNWEEEKKNRCLEFSRC